MSSRSTLILALALLATSNTSAYARPQPHPNLRAGKISFETPLADKKLVKDAALEVVELPSSWNGLNPNIEVPVSLSHDEN
jgi:hypothetical protein